ncbi:MAG: hypothetical protein GY870_11615, partial [archaeon]|nr:hypothetical protein [archaeon]
NIESGDFAKEWSKNRSKAKFKVIKAFATRQKISKIEQQVRKNLRMKEIEAGSSDEVEEILAKHPELKDELNDLKRDGDSFIFSV